MTVGREFVPCSPKHKSCSPAHAELVRGYREERQRQEAELEDITNGYDGELERWRENGGKLITFKEWLIGHKDRNREVEENEQAFDEVRNGGQPHHCEWTNGVRASESPDGNSAANCDCDTRNADNFCGNAFGIPGQPRGF